MRDEKKQRELAEKALAARETAYCGYSGFSVGAALLCADGAVYTGGNIENSSYGATNCAERTAFFTAVHAGKRQFSAIAIAGGPAGGLPPDFCAPCGICRQVMAEFCSSDFTVLLVKSRDEIKAYTLAGLLPASFTKENLK